MIKKAEKEKMDPRELEILVYMFLVVVLLLSKLVMAAASAAPSKSPLSAPIIILLGPKE